MNSSVVKEALGRDDSKYQCLLKYVQNVITFEQEFLFVSQKNVCHFDIAHNSAHEGLNFGMKSHAASVKPNQGMLKSCEALTIQASIKAQMLDQDAAQNYSKKKNWSETPTSNYLTMQAESILNTIYKKKKNYITKRLSLREFEVHYQPTKEDNESEQPLEYLIHPNFDYFHAQSPVPFFKRIRYVNLDFKNVGFCSCKYFERCGIPCVHLFSVFCHLSPNDKPFVGFSHHDVAIRWWSSYLYHGYLPSSPDNLRNCFDKLSHNDILGPKFIHPLESQEEYVMPTKVVAPLYRILNYSHEDLVHLHMFESNSQMEQEGFLHSQEHDASDESVNGNDHQISVFDNSTSDLGGSLVNKNSLSIEEMYRPLIRETFNILNHLKSPQQNEKLKSLLETFNKEARAELVASKPTDNNDESTAMIAPEKESSKRKRVFNTYTMRNKKAN